MSIPDELRYTADHEWVHVEGMIAKVGITDFAQSALGDVVFLDLPAVGESGEAGAAICEVESTKSVSDINSPLDGNVVAVNDSLESEPAEINTDPYGAGWVFKLEFTDPTQLENLLDAKAYADHIS